MKRIIKLAPNVSSWCDPTNHIYLTMPNKMSKEIPEGVDMTNIEKGIKAGLIRMKEVPVQKPVPQVKVEVKIVEPEPMKEIKPEPVKEVKQEEVVEQPKPKKSRKKKEVVEEKIEDNKEE